MSLLGLLASACRPFVALRSFSSLTCRVPAPLPCGPAAPVPSARTAPSLLDACARVWPSVTQVRTGMRVHFPRPREVKRLRAHGWKTRLQSASGRRIIMRRMLKGRHVLSH
ncbi:39S ribosomal protein L34, mitochondrial-like isoform X2 [Pollicipes pollicipes]|nr:39S ribosomal protein L34, mitochondrial-like isoform X2 [Pollicipes pollicipes]XP_037080097.1 39S ribosomal protein L34, mitochondrial-like isoform X2 [Pollicipes pollicipes]